MVVVIGDSGKGQHWVSVMDDDGGVRKRGLWLVVNVDGIQIECWWLPTLMRTNIYNEYKPNQY